jgi:hypothetical protein
VFYAFASESKRNFPMRITGVTPHRGRVRHPADTARMVAHLYGNQAMLRMRDAGVPWPFFEPVRPSQGGVLQRKCACGGECADCQEKQAEGAAGSPAFFGEVEDVVGGSAPGQVAPPPVPTEAGAKKAPDCNDICDRAYKDPSMNRNGGGVICDGDTKCPCVFDGVSMKRGQCPDWDRITITHEKKHLPEVDCDPQKGLHQPPFRDKSKLEAMECAHRKDDIPELEKALKKAGGGCKAQIDKHLKFLRVWVKGTCGE